MYVAILGYGTVGSGVFDVLTQNRDIIAKRVGFPLDVKYVLDLREFPGDPVEPYLTHDFEDILKDDSVEIVVETMGGLKPAYEFTKRALESGRSVCTSNKELVAKHGAELIEIAREKSINYLFEASVGGGIPVIRQLIRSITADEVEEVCGILNGTTNYMMTLMREQNLSFEEALKDAQGNGFAERNPAADIEGHDACRKIAILTSLAYGRQVDFEDIYTEGITGITDIDVAYAKAMKHGIKLLGRSYMKDGIVYAIVAPYMIRKTNPLYPVNGVYNAIMIRGNMLNDVVCYGKGAGKLPTASAVASDVIDAAKHRHVNIPILWEKQKMILGSKGDMESKFFVRVPIAEAEKAKEIFPIRKEISILECEGREFAFVTEVMSERDFAEAAAKIDIIGRIRYEI
ncbi:MAG: homoserine dehydrogenase [Lachnospiraceae bacterium]|nr:homoserine dehydrogenase [Lachnospiraceae bacterium]